MDLESLRLAEAFFSKWPESLPIVRAFLPEALARWPEAEIVTQKSQVGLRAPRPFCALTPPVRRAKGWPKHAVTLSLFLSRPLAPARMILSVEPYPGRWTNHIPLCDPAELDEELWAWVDEARKARNP